MPSLTTTELTGFCEAVAQFMQSNQTDLQSKGLNVAGWITELGTLKATAVSKNDEQEALKAQLRQKTQETEIALKTAYESASTKLDAVVGSLGKTSEMGKQAARLRSDIRNGSRKPATVSKAV